MLQFIEENDTAVTHVMNFLEEIGTCCHHGLADGEMMRSEFDYVVASVWDKLFDWIKKQRLLRRNDSIWEDTERLYDAWKQRT